MADAASRIIACVRVFQTMAWSQCSGVYLLAHAPGVPRDEDWAQFIEEAKDTRFSGIVVMAGTARLSPKQRADVQKWFEAKSLRGSVVTDSAVARGVVTALGWFKVKLRAFSTREIDAAFEYAGLAPEHHDDARSLLDRLERALREGRRTG